MTNREIVEILTSKCVNRLYHSNTVETAISFLRAGGLLSRGLCEHLGYPQTPQNSDQLDREFDIYYDLFFDSVDIHERAHNANYYGPVLFEYNISVLDSIPEGCIRITKSNPINWNANITEDEQQKILDSLKAAIKDSVVNGKVDLDLAAKKGKDYVHD